ncbi:hypothetical protein L1887_20938 [Cichorium endivia]|nr:hypothetical protein L1887_20938 [Cichorium endivia]
MEGLPATVENSGGDVLAQSQQQPAQPHVNGGGGGDGGGSDGGGGDELGDDGGAIGGGFTEDGDRNSSGNRWPKQETLALIKIRSEMDAAFRDSNLKGPLWDDVSRKLSELGFRRSAKKCREKFENVYKYHRRTKEGRTSKSDKIYRFSDQLQALEQNPRGAFPPQPPASVKPPPVLVDMSNTATVPSAFNVTGSYQNNVSPISVAAPAAMVVLPPQPVMNHKRTFPFSQPIMSGSTNSATSSDTFSDDEPPRKKRKWQDFFEKLMKEVMQKQEELQIKFLDAIERRERNRVAREEAWRAQEIAKMNQEHDRLLKERSIAAAKDAAVITFLQKMTGKNPDTMDETRKKLADFLAPPMPLASTLPVLQQQQIHQTPPPVQQPQPPPHHEVPRVAVPPPVMKNFESDAGGGDNMLSPSPSRWPKAEINALITLRTQLDMNYQENAPKGPLWEEISAAMRKLGYNRNAKRCKEKWENINKYYKKMKDGNKKRPQDSKTCPYFDQLDAIYRDKATAIIARPEQQWPPSTVVQEKTPPPPQQEQPTNAVHMEKGDNYPGFTVKPETPTAPVVAWPQQQWGPPAVLQETQQQPLSTADVEDQGSENTDDYDDEDEDDDKEEGGGYEIVASKISSMAAV